jgi:hypothetical protein
MKNLKTVIAILAISLSTIFSTTASEKEPSKITKKLRTEIVSLIGDKIELDLKKECSAEVSFMINNKNEIVVISVDSKENKLTSYIKSKLNYKKLVVEGTKVGEIYIMPIKINIEK